jgi:hypothetical protein
MTTVPMIQTKPKLAFVAVALPTLIVMVMAHLIVMIIAHLFRIQIKWTWTETALEMHASQMLCPQPRSAYLSLSQTLAVTIILLRLLGW